MKNDRAHLLGYAIVGLLAVGALSVSRPSSIPTPAARLATPSAAAWRERVDTLGRGETLSGVLERGGLQGRDAAAAIRAAGTVDARRVPAGMQVTVASRIADSVPSHVVLHMAIDRLVRLNRTDSGWVSTEERLPWTTDTLVVGGVINSTLYEAFDSSASALPRPARAELAWSLADIFEYRVDMSRDLQAGDAFRVLFERSTAPNGAVRVGRVLAANFVLSGSRVDAVRYQSAATPGGEYFDGEGKSLRASFLRAPLAFRRISSVFGLRKHPILGIWRAHKGTDYAASSGTPVRSVGEGVVTYAGWRGGYGRTVEVRHRNGFVSRYGHLRSFAPGVRSGAHAGIGQTVGFVGMTGLATAPHLHFEVLVNGVHRDPRTALKQRGGEPIPSSERAQFERVRTQLLAALDDMAGTVRAVVAN